QGRHGLRHQAAARTARAARQARARRFPVHARRWATPQASALGAARAGGRGRLHGVDRARQAAPSTSRAHARRQAGARSDEGNAVITHPEKLLFPDDGISKGEVAAYYEAVAPYMLPHLRGRPVTLERFPAGISAKGFMQKDVVKGFPDWLER